MAARRALACAIAAASAAHARALPTVRVLPLGDSITFGCGSDAAPPDWYACCTPLSGGYRAPLWAALNGSGVNATIQMVGTQSNGPAWVPEPQRAHEGHPGWTINEIAGLQAKWVALQPDVVLLMAGTNDVTQGHSNATMQADYAKLLASLRGTLPAARLVVASIFNIADSSGAGPSFPPALRALNAALPGLAAAVGGSFVDMNAATGMCAAPGSAATPLCAVCNGPCGGYNPAVCPPSGYS